VGLLGRLRGRSEEPPVSDRWLVAGLGNPESEYGGTRHNVGADAVRRLGERLGLSFKPHKSGCLVADGFSRPGGEPLTLALPTSYMNRSGGPVQQAAAFYKVPPERVVVAHDELDLPVAALKLKQGGGTGGHNGLKDVQQRLGTPDFLRVRIGIGRPPGRQDPADYVLKRFSSKDREQIEVTLEEAGDAILHLIEHGLEATQNRYHRT
jgi:PTH1 family peptidyl-tRNA hydrolase